MAAWCTTPSFQFSIKFLKFCKYKRIRKYLNIVERYIFICIYEGRENRVHFNTTHWLCTLQLRREGFVEVNRRIEIVPMVTITQLLSRDNTLQATSHFHLYNLSDASTSTSKLDSKEEDSYSLYLYHRRLGLGPGLFPVCQGKKD